jgi:glycosyltransferase involved in cell wall biosynthesis
VNAPHLIIDGRHIDGRSNGLSRVSEELTLALSEIKGLKLTVVSNRPITPRTPLPGDVQQLIDKSVWARLPGSFWLSARVPTIAKQLRATHVLGILHMLPLFKPKGVIYGLLMHDLVYIFFPETMTPSNRWMSRIFIPRSLRIADNIFAVSQSTLDDISQQYPELQANNQVAFPGSTFSVPLLPRPSLDGPLRLLFVGSREPRKNLSPLLQAYDIARSRGFEGELHLVSGASWGNNKVAGIIKKHLGRGIFVHEKISDNELIRLYDAADYLVMPSLYEGLGLPIIEAVGRCAVLANNIPVFRELGRYIDGISYLCFKEDPASLEELSKNLLTLQRSTPARFRSKSIQLQFSWKACARSITGSLFERRYGI